MHETAHTSKKYYVRREFSLSIGSFNLKREFINLEENSFKNYLLKVFNSGKTGFWKIRYYVINVRDKIRMRMM